MNAYDNFDIRIERDGQGYRLRAESSVGEAKEEFTSPFTEEELREFDQFVLGSVLKGEINESTRPPDVQDFGSRLFESVFKGEILIYFRTCLYRRKTPGLAAGLRIRLHLAECPELGELPWEFLYDKKSCGFLAISKTTPVVRYLHVAHPIEPLVTQPPLRILVVTASPDDFPPLDIEREWNALEEGLKGLARRGRVKLFRLGGASLDSLREELDIRDYHILHFVGHSMFDESSQNGLLVMQRDTGESQPVRGEELGALLKDHDSLRLIVLNSCEGARATGSDPFSGVAQSLLKQGAPAVIAMRTEITDSAAVAMADELYKSLFRGRPIDEALTGVRKAIFSRNLGGVEWGAPQLYMRAPDGVIFKKTTETILTRVIVYLAIAVALVGLNFLFPGKLASARESIINTFFAPEAPSGLRVAETKFNSATLVWRDNSDNESGFEIWRSDGDYADRKLVGEAGADVTTIVDSTVEPDSTYIFSVRSFENLEFVSQVARSSFSAARPISIPAKPDPDPPPPPPPDTPKIIIEIPPDSGHVRVVAGWSGGTVYIDSQRQMKVTTYTFKLAVGTHNIRVVYETGAVKETTLVVIADTTIKFITKRN